MLSRNLQKLVDTAIDAALRYDGPAATKSRAALEKRLARMERELKRFRSLSKYGPLPSPPKRWSSQ